jgi:hypothetical protein
MEGNSLSANSAAGALLAFSFFSVEGGYLVLGLTMAAVLIVGTLLMAQNKRDLLRIANQAGVTFEKKDGTPPRT